METGEGRLETGDREGLGDARAARPNPSLAREAVAQGTAEALSDTSPWKANLA